MSTREDIQAAIDEMIAGAGPNVLGSLDVNEIALRLSSQYPQSGFHLEQLCEMIEAALGARLAVGPGNKEGDTCGG